MVEGPFYSQYDPEIYLASGGSSRTSEKCFTIDNIYFGNCKGKLRIGDYYITLGSETFSQGSEIKKVTYSDNDPAVTIYQLQ